MKCSKCGHTVPEGSAFCNHCGAAINTNTPCPHCEAMIPAESVFCPKCGKMVRDDMDENESTIAKTAATAAAATATTAAASKQPTYNELQRELEEERRRVQESEARAKQAQRELQRAQEEWDDEEDDDDDDEGNSRGSNFNRNMLIGIGVLAALIILLTIMRGCGNSDNPKNSLGADSAQVVTNSGAEPLAIFNAELSRANFTGDGAVATCAVRFDAAGDKPERIVGVTCLSSNTNRSFYKIYTLTRDGVNWKPELAYMQPLDGRTITMDNSSLIADINQVPRAVKLGDKDYLYFAYLNLPTGGSSMGRVSLALFDIDSKNKKPTTVDYDGPFKTRDDGRQYIYGKPLQSISSEQARWLDGEAHNLKILYFPTEEELKAEEDAKAKADSLKALADPERASEMWNQNNNENLDQLKEGKEVKNSTQTYDKPIFNMKDIAKKIENDAYIVFRLKDGTVQGFNKDKRRYFVIYSPSKGGEGATDIGFGGENNRTVRMRTSDGHIAYDLNTGKSKLID